MSPSERPRRKPRQTPLLPAVLLPAGRRPSKSVDISTIPKLTAKHPPDRETTTTNAKAHRTAIITLIPLLIAAGFRFVPCRLACPLNGCNNSNDTDKGQNQQYEQGPNPIIVATAQPRSPRRPLSLTIRWTWIASPATRYFLRRSGRIAYGKIKAFQIVEEQFRKP